MKPPKTLPDHLRCNRNDGRQWRCVKRVMPGFKLCENHHIQQLHRSRKQTVPSSVKLIRTNNKTNTENERSSQSQRELRESGEVVNAETLLEKMSAEKEGLLHLELLRVFLKSRIAKRKKDEKNSSKCNNLVKRLLRDLPNGVMEISKVPVVNVGLFGGRKVEFSRFRCKNLERLPSSGSFQGSPFGRNVAELRRGGGRMKCHRCRRSESGGTIVRCSRCQIECFCKECIQRLYSQMPEEVKISCPVCSGTCNCITCSSNKPKDGEFKELTRGEKGVNNILHFHYLVCQLLPVLKRINQEQRIELEIESKIKGKRPSEVQIQRVECGPDEQLSCDNCKTSILDFHRSCSNCSYDLCLGCCQEIRCGRLPGGIGRATVGYIDRGKTYMHGGKSLPVMNTKKISSLQEIYNNTSVDPSMSVPGWEVNSNDDSISCAPEEYGGCGNNRLDLRCVLPFNWTEELERSADEIVCSYELPETLDALHCSFCISERDRTGETDRKLQEAARREDSDDNFLFCSSRQDIQDDLEHFQKHWSKGQPVIVRNVLQSNPDLSWDPLTMFCTFLGKGIVKPENDTEAVQAIDCLDWCEVEIGIQQFLEGYLEGRMHSNMWPEMLKLKDWPSSKVFQEQFPAYNTEFLHGLPFQEYTNPDSGIFNLACKMPQEFSKPDLGPHVYIAYGMEEELGQGDSVTKLYCDSSDVVNILAHTAEVALCPDQLKILERLKKKYKAQDKGESFNTFTNLNLAKEVKEESCFVFDNTEVDSKDMMSISGGEINLSEEVSGVSFVENMETDSRVRMSTNVAETNLSEGASGLSVVLQVPGECAVVKDDNMCDSEEYDSHSKVQIYSQRPTETTLLKEKEESSTGLGGKLVSNSGGARWDVFRREDVPKLEEYLRKYSNEFRHTYCSRIEHVSNPIVDQCFFLDLTHKKRLKEEFKVEPWTFDQHLGEAIIIPAGCPYQIRNLKSCINVALDFVSPENVSKGIHLIDELRLLPDNHRAKLDRLEVKKMSVYGISSAVKEIQELRSMISFRSASEFRDN